MYWNQQTTNYPVQQQHQQPQQYYDASYYESGYYPTVPNYTPGDTNSSEEVSNSFEAEEKLKPEQGTETPQTYFPWMKTNQGIYLI